MSFAQETKNELARFTPEKKCCMLAEIAGFMRIAGSVRLVGGGKFKIVLTTLHPAVARHYKTMIESYFNIETEVEVGRANSVKKGNRYILSIGHENLSEQILRETGILMVKEGMNFLSDGIYEGLIKSKCCRRAYLRGVFLAGGTINSPEKSYHFEIDVATEVLAKDIRRLMNTFVDINASIVTRKKGYGIYLKKGEQVRDALGIMEAGGMFLKFDDVMMMKELRAKSQRVSNFDDANIDKALKASEAQVESIRKIEERKGLDYLSPKLQEAARLRLEHPELGIAELGQLINPPLSKSGINNRLRRIEEIARAL